MDEETSGAGLGLRRILRSRLSGRSVAAEFGFAPALLTKETCLNKINEGACLNKNIYIYIYIYTPFFKTKEKEKEEKKKKTKTLGG